MWRLIFCSGLLFSTVSGHAQRGSEQYNSLLWRISGNGLTRPSYLYGTMHIMDKRLFYFGDSLYKALEQSEGFAAELDLATFTNDYIRLFLNEKADDDNSLADVLDEKELNQYKISLEKKFGKPVDKITTGDIEKKRRQKENELLMKGEMKTFMDAYLFDIAYNQGKWTGGIEDFEDQSGLFDNESLNEKIEDVVMPKERSEHSLEWMVNVYLRQDLAQIDRSDEIWRGSKDRVLIMRNVKMSRRIDSLANIRTCLFAIGAAHLPGDSGVVALLRSRGFIVTPVQSSKKIDPGKYTYKRVQRPWVDVATKDSLYSLQMPGKTEEMSALEERLPLGIRMYFDLSNMVFYMTMAIEMPQVSADKRDSLLNLMAARFRKKDPGLKEKKVMVGNERGLEFIMENEDGLYRLQAFAPGGYVTINGVFALKGSGTLTSDADRFFQSFRSNHLPVKPRSPGWQEYSFADHAFSIELPAKYRQKKDKDSDDAWNQYTYEVSDMAGNAYYAVFVAESKPGYYSSEDSSYFERVLEAMEKNTKARKVSGSHYDMNGYPAFEYVMELEEKGEELGLKVLLVNRGNRKYFLLATYDRNNPEPPNRFISSFHLLPQPKHEWHLETDPGRSFKIWSPSALTMKMDTAADVVRYYIYDSTSIIPVSINKEAISPYYWAASDSMMYDQRVRSFVGYNDSLLEYKKIKNGKIAGIDLLIQLGGTHNLKKMRLLFSGDTLYTLFGFMPKESLASPDYIRLFEGFQVIHETTPRDLTVRQPAALLKALLTSDSIKFTQAKNIFEKVEFEKEDIPLLEEALLQLYYDFDTSSVYYYSGLNADIRAEVLRLDSNNTVVEFIKNNYSLIPAEKEKLKPFLLSLLGTIRTRESTDLLKQIILEKPPRIGEEYYFPHRLYDSLSLSRRLYPEIFSATKEPGLKWLINGIATSLLDSGLLAAKDLLSYREVIMGNAKDELSKSEEELEENAYDLYDMVQLLGALNLAEANEILNQFGKIDNNGLRLKVTVALLKNKQPVDSKNIRKLAESDEFRSDLYDELKKLGKLSFFPASFLSQKLLGQSKLYVYATDDDESPGSVEFIGERVELFMGQKQKFYLFKVAYEGEDTTTAYLGVAGPYSLNAKDYSSTHKATGVVWQDSFDAKKINSAFKQYLSDMEESLKNVDDEE